jgi:hypothetical protein
MEAIQSDALLPLIIGVTGHRKISTDDPRLRECIRGELLRIREAYPDSPFVVLSGLAEGADRLVVRIAIECLAAKVIAVLPFAEEEFRKDFPAPESQAEFSDLLKQSQAVVVVPQRESPEAVCQRGEARNRQYARVGAYVMEQAQILIALWDGKPARGTGGTGDVVKWRMSGEVPFAFSSVSEEQNLLSADDPARLTHIHPQTCEVKHLAGSLETRDATDAALGAIDSFNRDATNHARENGKNAFLRARRRFLMIEETEPLIQDDKGLLRLASLFAAADALASRLQKKDVALVGTIAFIFFLAMTFVHQPLMPVVSVAAASTLYLAFMLLLWVLLRLASRWRIEEGFLDYRALAEGLRVAVFWRLAGVHQKVSLNYLNEHLNVLSWVRQALRSAEISALPEAKTAPALSSEKIALVENLWLRNQAEYFHGKLKQLQGQVRKWKGIGGAAFILSCVAMAWKLIARLSDQLASLPYATALTGLTVAAGIAIGYFTQKKSFAALMKRYTLSAALYRRALGRLQARQYPPEKVLLQMGKEALNENADWLWLQRQTPLKPRR